MRRIQHHIEHMNFLIVAVLFLAARPLYSQRPAPPEADCAPKSTAVALGSALYFPGDGHLYVGGGERRRGVVLRDLGFASMAILGSLLLPRVRNNDALFFTAIGGGLGTYTLTTAFSVGDAVPAVRRQAKRCERKAAVTPRDTLRGAMIWISP